MRWAWLGARPKFPLLNRPKPPCALAFRVFGGARVVSTERPRRALRDEIERFGLEGVGWVSFSNVLLATVQSGGVPGLGREFGEERAVAVRELARSLVRFVRAFSCAPGERTALATGQG